MTRNYYFLGLLLLAFVACTPDNQSMNTAKGEELAKAYCSGCHAYVEPELLDKSTWEDYILPRMGNMLGVYESENQRDELMGTSMQKALLEKSGIYPSEQVIGDKIWQEIKDYILSQAPETLPAGENPGIASTLPHFQFRPSPYRMSPPSTTYLDITDNGRIYLGDANSQALYQFSSDLKLVKAANVRESVVDLLETPSELLLTIMGSFSPTELPTGFVMSLPTSQNLQIKIMIDSLRRPVHTNFADYNGDKRTDLVICEFAKYTGKMSWYEQLPDGEFAEHLLRNKTGATRALNRDYDGDGDIDIIALFGQGDEGIFLYRNDGKGKFVEERLLSFPATYGSSYFDMVDIDQDSVEEILYTCGDNADYPAVLKPYHGIYIYDRQEDGSYEQSFFYHLNGAYKAIPADFDMDGDMDMAAISFFPDYQDHPEEGFVYLQNQGEFEFKAFSFPEVEEGRWIVIDAGDLDQDGDIDIALGSLTFEVPGDTSYISKWVSGGLPYVFLENTIR